MIGQESRYNTGILLTLSGALAWAIYAILQKKLVISFSAGTLNLFLFGFPALVYLPFVDFNILADLSLIWWALLIFLGVNTLIAYGSLAQALKYTAASKVSIILILNPIITFTIMGILTIMKVTWIEEEKFSFLSLIGALIILTGATLVVGKNQKKPAGVRKH